MKNILLLNQTPYSRGWGRRNVFFPITVMGALRKHFNIFVEPPTPARDHYHSWINYYWNDKIFNTLPADGLKDIDFVLVVDAGGCFPQKFGEIKKKYGHLPMVEWSSDPDFTKLPNNRFEYTMSMINGFNPKAPHIKIPFFTYPKIFKKDEELKCQKINPLVMQSLELQKGINREVKIYGELQTGQTGRGWKESIMYDDHILSIAAKTRHNKIFLDMIKNPDGFWNPKFVGSMWKQIPSFPQEWLIGEIPWDQSHRPYGVADALIQTVKHSKKTKIDTIYTERMAWCFSSETVLVTDQCSMDDEALGLIDNETYIRWDNCTLSHLKNKLGDKSLLKSIAARAKNKFWQYNNETISSNIAKCLNHLEVLEPGRTYNTLTGQAFWNKEK